MYLGTLAQVRRKRFFGVGPAPIFDGITFDNGVTWDNGVYWS